MRQSIVQTKYNLLNFVKSGCHHSIVVAVIPPTASVLIGFLHASLVFLKDSQCEFTLVLMALACTLLLYASVFLCSHSTKRSKISFYPEQFSSNTVFNWLVSSSAATLFFQICDLFEYFNQVPPHGGGGAPPVCTSRIMTIGLHPPR